MLAAIVIGFMSLSWAFAANAESTPKARSFRALAQLLEELALLHRADFVDFEGVRSDQSRQDPQLRHAMQVARTVRDKILKLRAINGLARPADEPIAARFVQYDDVATLIEAALRDTRGLRPIYRVTTPTSVIAVPEDGTVAELARGLRRADAMVEALGVPEPVPNDVYRIALALNGDIDDLLSARKLLPVEVPPTIRDKTPELVFTKARALLELLKATVEEDPALTVPGGITLPRHGRRPARPKEVLDLLSDILSDVAALKVALGLPAPTRFASEQVGKTPSDVYDQVARAMANIGRFRHPPQSALNEPGGNRE